MRMMVSVYLDCLACRFFGYSGFEICLGRGRQGIFELCQ
jgi:hypothetical protein